MRVVALALFVFAISLIEPTHADSVNLSDVEAKRVIEQFWKRLIPEAPGPQNVVTGGLACARNKGGTHTL